MNLFRSAGIFTILLLGTHLATAQAISVGIEGGVRTTDDVEGSLSSESKRYIVGPAVELGLPMRLSVEVDALYRSFGFTGYAAAYGLGGSSITRERSNSWEFPMILKYRLPIPLVHPFVGIGYAPRRVHGTDVSSGYYISGISTTNPPAYIITDYSVRRSTNYSITHAVVVSGGVNLDAGHFRFSPELRYEHWNQPFLAEIGGDGTFSFFSKQDEVLILLGISWH